MRYKLLVDDWSIIDTALETGLTTDQSHLHRHFKKITGLTPDQYAQGCKDVQATTSMI